MLREGAADYLVKPFAAEELRARVGNLVGMKRARDVLLREAEGRQAGLEVLAREVSLHERKSEASAGGGPHRPRAGRARHAGQKPFPPHGVARAAQHRSTPLILNLACFAANRSHPLTAAQDSSRRKIAEAADRLRQPDRIDPGVRRLAERPGGGAGRGARPGGAGAEVATRSCGRRPSARGWPCG